VKLSISLSLAVLAVVEMLAVVVVLVVLEQALDYQSQQVKHTLLQSVVVVALLEDHKVRMEQAVYFQQ
jgi:hypothetical protein